jgi:hypothetical protein
VRGGIDVMCANRNRRIIIEANNIYIHTHICVGEHRGERETAAGMCVHTIKRRCLHIDLWGCATYRTIYKQTIDRALYLLGVYIRAPVHARLDVSCRGIWVKQRLGHTRLYTTQN